MVRVLHNQTACSCRSMFPFELFYKDYEVFSLFFHWIFVIHHNIQEWCRESARVGVRKRTRGGDQVIAPPGGQERLSCCQRDVTVPRHEPRYKSKQLQTKQFSHTLFSKEQPSSLWFSHPTTITSPFHSYKTMKASRRGTQKIWE